LSTDYPTDPAKAQGGQPAPPVHHRAPSEPHHERGRMILIVAGIITLIIVLIVGILPRIKQKQALAQGVKEAKTSLPEVTVTKPTWVFDPGISLPGNIEAIKATVINARSTGYLKQLFVDIGSQVTAGEVLGVVQSPDVDQQLNQAQAQTAQSRATVQQSQANVATSQATVAQDQAEVAKQRFMVQQARQAVAVANAQLAQSQAAEKGAESGVAHADQALKVQQAAFRQSQAQRDLAKGTNQRYQNLVAQGFDSQQDADTAAASYKVAMAAVDSAQAAVDSAVADVATAQQTLVSAKSAVVAAQANVESAVENVSAAQAELVSTQAVVDAAMHAVRASVETVKANQAAVKSTVANARFYGVMTGFQKIIAPFTGVITARNVDVGTLISAGGSETGVTTPAPQSGILGIARTDVVRIQVSVPQTYVPEISQGSNTRITVRELPGEVFTGNISMRAGALDTTSRTQLVEVHIANPTNSLVPGMYAEVKITPIHPARTIHIQGTALIVDANGTRVAIVNPDKTVHLQTVKVGRDFGQQIEIMSGLEGNELLVNTPSDILQEGQKVTILKSSGGKGAKKKGAAAAGSTTAESPGTGGQAADSPTTGGAAAQGQTPDGQTSPGQETQGQPSDAAQPASGQAPGAPGKHGHHKHPPGGTPPDTSGQPATSSVAPAGG
jgi:RND family efflux transporter MFP subunit